MKRKYKIVFLSICLFSCALLNFINSNSMLDQGPSSMQSDNFDQEKLLNSYTSVSPFFIDDHDPLKSWNYYKTTYAWCTGTGTLADPYIIDGISIGGAGSVTCLEVRWTSAGTYWTIQNSYFTDTGTSCAGIFVGSSSNGDILSNIFYDCYFGIDIQANSDNMYLYNNTVTDGLWGINVENSDNTELEENIILRCQNQGIAIENSASCKVIGNVVNDTTGKTIPADIEMGIWVAESNNIEIINNTCYNNDKDGIMIVTCDYATVSGNIANNNGECGIRLLDCDECDVIGNRINDNALYGIFEHDDCINNIFQNNTCNTGWIDHPFIIDDAGGGDYTWAEAVSKRDWCSGTGTINDPYIIGDLTVDGGSSVNCIEIRNSTAYFKINNSIFSNGIIGIKLMNASNGELINNTVNTCLTGEIWLYGSDDNNITGNIIDSSSNYAIYLGYSDQNNVSLNKITGNAHCVYEINSINNIIENNICNINIIITINSPTPSQLTGSIAPGFDISLSIIDPDATWYTLDGGTINTTFTGLTGTIDQTVWDGHGAGPVTIRFYANNSMNYQGYSEVTVDKDLSGPIINIISPESNDIFDSTAPLYNVTIEGPLLDTYWYTLDGGATNYTFTLLDDQINQTAWDSRPDGNVTIIFYANTTTANENSNEVQVRKDTATPSITINSPTSTDLFGLSAPGYSISITELNINTIWYTLDGGTTNITITTTTGTINQTIWEGIGNGTATIRFYVSDDLTRENYTEVTVRKDIIKPNITIISPLPNELFGFTTPIYNITLDEANPGTTSYNLVGDITNHTITGTTGNISLASWDLFGNGTLTIRFYSIDAVGNMGFAEVTIRKDIINPVITIHTPISLEHYSTTSPTFNITIDEPHFNTSWYTIIGIPLIFPFLGTTGIITQWFWDLVDDGALTLRFYVDDKAGNIGYSEVQLTKDTASPVISILDPEGDILFGERAPDYNITVYEPFLDRTWYKIIGAAVNYTFSGLTAGFFGTIDQTGWELFWNETVTLRFYASDQAGNIGFEDVVITKDIYAELIFEIISPESNAEYEDPPAFKIYISILNVTETWYTLDNGETTIPFTGFRGVIDPTVWNEAPNGTVTIRFYMRDADDNVVYREVDVIKLGELPGYREVNQATEFFAFLFGFPNVLLTVGCTVGVVAGGVMIIKKEKDPDFLISKKRKKGPMK